MGSAEDGIPFWFHGQSLQPWSSYDWEIEELARAEWGLDAAVMDPLDSAMMMAAYVRRKQWEADRVAVAVWDLLGKALNQRKGPGAGSPSGGKSKMSGMQLLHTIGVEG